MSNWKSYGSNLNENTDDAHTQQVQKVRYACAIRACEHAYVEKR